MKKPVLACEPLGDSALMVVVGPAGDPTIPLRVRLLAEALAKAEIQGVLDIAPAYAAVTVFYDPLQVQGEGALPYHRVAEAVMEVAEESGVGQRRISKKTVEDRLIELPVCYGGEFGPDLIDVARRAKLSEEAAAELHASVEYVVQAIGFAPGFPYLAGLKDKLHTPRRATPREIVAVGSVGIGGGQTGIYPLATPGGWNLIGRTPSTLFRTDDHPPALLRVGDRVRFKPISREEFAAWK